MATTSRKRPAKSTAKTARATRRKKKASNPEHRLDWSTTRALTLLGAVKKRIKTDGFYTVAAVTQDVIGQKGFMGDLPVEAVTESKVRNFLASVRKIHQEVPEPTSGSRRVTIANLKDEEPGLFEFFNSLGADNDDDSDDSDSVAADDSEHDEEGDNDVDGDTDDEENDDDDEEEEEDDDEDWE